MIDNYPPGLENDPNAPYNFPDTIPGKEVIEDDGKGEIDWDEEDPEEDELDDLL